MDLSERLEHLGLFVMVFQCGVEAHVTWPIPSNCIGILQHALSKSITN